MLELLAWLALPDLLEPPMLLLMPPQEPPMLELLAWLALPDLLMLPQEPPMLELLA